MLTGEMRGLQNMPRMGRASLGATLQALQRAFRGPGGVMPRSGVQAISTRSPALKWCIRSIHRENAGSAEVEISVLFTDVHRSTTIAETMAPDLLSLLRALLGARPR